MKISKHPTPRDGAGGFSLIEVTIALGITAIALVSLMGMLPKGMETLRRAADKAIEGRIHQQILGELQLTPWEAKGGGNGDPLVEKFDKEIRFYDDQGIELQEFEKGGVDHVYTARIHVPTPGSSLPLSVGSGTYSGVMDEDSSGDGLTFLRLVIVEVTSIVDPRFLDNPQTAFEQPEFQKNIRTFRTFIAKMGQEYQPSSAP
jgi:uncharacterized protein (TIGR02598 family)